MRSKDCHLVGSNSFGGGLIPCRFFASLPSCVKDGACVEILCCSLSKEYGNVKIDESTDVGKWSPHLSDGGFPANPSRIL